MNVYLFVIPLHVIDCNTTGLAKEAFGVWKIVEEFLDIKLEALSLV